MPQAPTIPMMISSPTSAVQQPAAASTATSTTHQWYRLSAACSTSCLTATYSQPHSAPTALPVSVRTSVGAISPREPSAGSSPTRTSCHLCAMSCPMQRYAHRMARQAHRTSATMTIQATSHPTAMTDSLEPTPPRSATISCNGNLRTRLT